MSAVMLVVEPKPIVGLATTQRQDAETVLYFAAFLLIMPGALVGGPRLARLISSGPNAAGLSSLAGLLVAAFAAAILLVRFAEVLPRGGGERTALLTVGAWSAAAAAAFTRAIRPRPWPPLLRVAGVSAVIWAVAAVLALGTLLTVTDLGSVSLLPLAVGPLVIPAAVLLYGRSRFPRLRSRWLVTAEILVVALVLLAIPDLVIFSPEDPQLSPVDAYLSGVIQFHHDLLLGPANQVLGGSPLLVDTASQYGVGSILLLAGWFELVPMGYGTSGLLDGLLTALWFLAGYGVLRMAGCSRLLSIGTLGAAVVALVLNREYAVGSLPQEGPLRFGLPLAVIVATVAASRWPRRSRPARAAAVAVVGLSSVWAVEAFTFSVVTFVAMACFEAHLRPGGRLRWLARQAALAVVACACAHLVFAAATLAATGQLPDWAQYLVFLDEFMGDLGDLTYDFAPWSPGLAVGAAYLASAAALVLLVRSRQDIVRRWPTTLLALTGTTAYGIAFFSYFVDRSASHVLAYVSLPAVLAGALWLHLALGQDAPPLPLRLRRGALAAALCVALLLVAVGWSSLGGRLDQSAVGHVVPGGPSLGKALDRLWHFPPVDRRAPRGERILARYMPGEAQSLVIVAPQLTDEILIRSGRANRLPLANAIEDSFVADHKKPALADAVAALQPGRRMLADREMLAALETVKRDPRSDLSTRLRGGAVTTPLQVYALRRIDQRFRLRPIYRDRDGFVVVELEPRR